MPNHKVRKGNIIFPIVWKGWCTWLAGPESSNSCDPVLSLAPFVTTLPLAKGREDLRLANALAIVIPSPGLTAILALGPRVPAIHTHVVKRAFIGVSFSTKKKDTETKQL